MLRPFARLAIRGLPTERRWKFLDVSDGAKPLRTCLLRLADEGQNLCAYFGQFFRGYFALPLGFSGAPIQALDLVGEDDALRRSDD